MLYDKHPDIIIILPLFLFIFHQHIWFFLSNELNQQCWVYSVGFSNFPITNHLLLKFDFRLIIFSDINIITWRVLDSNNPVYLKHAAAAAAKSLQSCPTLCDPIDSSPPGSTVPGIFQARTLEWVAISFSNVWKWNVKVKSEWVVVQSCPTLSDSMDCSLPGSSIHGIFQARVLEWGAIAFSSLKHNIY